MTASVNGPAESSDAVHRHTTAGLLLEARLEEVEPVVDDLVWGWVTVIKRPVLQRGNIIYIKKRFKMIYRREQRGVPGYDAIEGFVLPLAKTKSKRPTLGQFSAILYQNQKGFPQYCFIL